VNNKPKETKHNRTAKNDEYLQLSVALEELRDSFVLLSLHYQDLLYKDLLSKIPNNKFEEFSVNKSSNSS